MRAPRKEQPVCSIPLHGNVRNCLGQDMRQGPTRACPTALATPCPFGVAPFCPLHHRATQCVRGLQAQNPRRLVDLVDHGRVDSGLHRARPACRAVSPPHRMYDSRPMQPMAHPGGPNKYLGRTPMREKLPSDFVSNARSYVCEGPVRGTPFACLPNLRIHPPLPQERKGPLTPNNTFLQRRAV